MLDFYLFIYLSILIFSFFISAFIFYLFTTIFIDHAHWRFVYHIITSIWASYSIFSKSHTKTKIKTLIEIETKRAKWKSTHRYVFQIFEHSICWLHHKTTSINVVNNEDQKSERSENQLNDLFFRFSWLHHKAVSINVIISLVTQ